MKKGSTLLVGTATVLGLALRLNDLGRIGLGTDEGHSAWISAQPLADLPGLLGADSAPPLYYALLHAWQALLPSDAGLRSLSVLLGAAAVPALYLVGRRLAGEAAGVAAAFFMAVSNLHIEFSQSVKVYALFFLMSALALLALLAACERPRRTSRWVLFALALAGMLYTHAIAPFVAAGLTLFGAARLGRRLRAHLKAFAGAHGLAALIFAPWLVIAVPQAMAVVRGFWAPRPPPAAPFRTMSLFLIRPPWLPSGANPLIPEARPGLSGIPLLEPFTREGLRGAWTLIAWIALALSIALVARAPGLRHMLGLLLLALVPIAGLFTFSVLVGSIYLTRALLPSMAAFVLLLSAPFAPLGPDVRPGGAPIWLVRSSRAAAGAALIAMGLTGWHTTEVRRLPEWREAAAVISAGAAEGDAIVYDAHFGQIVLERYLEGTAAALPAYGVPSDWYDGRTPTVGKWVRSDEDIGRLREAAAAHGRIWLVRAHTYVHDRGELARGWCEENLELKARHEFPFIEVLQYARRGATPGGIAAGGAGGGES